MSRYSDDDDADDLDEREDPDPSDMDDDEETQDGSDWTDEPPRRSWVWAIAAVLVLIGFLSWVFRGIF